MTDQLPVALYRSVAAMWKDGKVTIAYTRSQGQGRKVLLERTTETTLTLGGEYSLVLVPVAGIAPPTLPEVPEFPEFPTPEPLPEDVKPPIEKLPPGVEHPIEKLPPGVEHPIEKLPPEVEPPNYEKPGGVPDRNRPQPK